MNQHNSKSFERWKISLQISADTTESEPREDPGEGTIQMSPLVMALASQLAIKILRARCEFYVNSLADFAICLAVLSVVHQLCRLRWTFFAHDFH